MKMLSLQWALDPETADGVVRNPDLEKDSSGLSFGIQIPRSTYLVRLFSPYQQDLAEARSKFTRLPNRSYSSQEKCVKAIWYSRLHLYSNIKPENDYSEAGCR
jgi:hypothetical protein